MKKALIVQGGWGGHQPEIVSVRFKGILEKNGYECTISDTLDSFNDLEYLMSLDLIIPIWTGGEITDQQIDNVVEAVAAGVGVTGCHGGMCDAFRSEMKWHFITGGQWVSHPGGDGVKYTVNINKGANPIVEGLEDFEVCSEHYYMHVDPAVEVLATTRFPIANYYHAANKPVDMPLAWTKFWGCGRVFYHSLGHQDSVFDNSPSAQTLIERGMLWAGEGKQYAIDNNLSVDRYKSDAKMY